MRIAASSPFSGAIRPIQPPLRWLARRWSRQLAAAQTIAVVEAGGTTVSLADLVSPTFYASPALMFSADRFHPSAYGYAAATGAMLPTLVTAAQLASGQVTVEPAGEGVRSLAQAAVEAANQAGTEVTGARVAGRERGPAGRWAQLRHRVRQLTQRPHDPTPVARARQDQASQHRRGERCEATLRWWIGTKKPIADRHERTTFRWTRPIGRQACRVVVPLADSFAPAARAEGPPGRQRQP